jgi:mRNA-degrading endonuclease RelE of RelBE toxin-antitoxin system
MKWGLVIASRAKRQFRRLSARDRDGIDRALSEMCDMPFQGALNFSM